MSSREGTVDYVRLIFPNVFNIMIEQHIAYVVCVLRYHIMKNVDFA